MGTIGHTCVCTRWAVEESPALPLPPVKGPHAPHPSSVPRDSRPLSQPLPACRCPPASREELGQVLCMNIDCWLAWIGGVGAAAG